MAAQIARHDIASFLPLVSLPGLIARIARWHDAWRQQQRLAQLDAHLMRDMGLGAHAAAREASRHGWDVGLPGLR